MAWIVNSPPLPPFHCLRCGYEFDRAGGIGHDPKPTPSAGGVSLCIRCGDVAIFVDGGGLRAPTDEEKREIERDADISRIRALLKRAIAERPS
jgi:hypothetical protein